MRQVSKLSSWLPGMHGQPLRTEGPQILDSRVMFMQVFHDMSHLRGFARHTRRRDAAHKGRTRKHSFCGARSARSWDGCVAHKLTGAAQADAAEQRKGQS